MKKIIHGAVLLLFLCGTAVAGGGLDVFMSDLNVQARADLPGFSTRVSAQFGIPVPEVHAVIGAVVAPADAFMVFQLGSMTHRPPAEILRVYKANRGRGWGVIAKEIGIKPGSSEFHALKQGNFSLHGGHKSCPGKSHGNGHGNGKGNGKGHKK